MNGRCVSVVVPLYNEERTIGELLQRVSLQPCVKEIIVVNDGSTDCSLDKVANIVGKSAIKCDKGSISSPASERKNVGTGYLNDVPVKVVSYRVNRGKGYAIRCGSLFCDGDIVIFQDADLEYRPEEYITLVRPILDEVADVVYGCRFGFGRNRNNPRWHTLGNLCLTWLSNVCSGIVIKDEATGYKVFSRRAFCCMNLVEDRFGICPELTAKIVKNSLRLVEVPISYSGRNKSMGKKIGWRDAISAVRCIVRYNLIDR